MSQIRTVGYAIAALALAFIGPHNSRQESGLEQAVRSTPTFEAQAPMEGFRTGPTGPMGGVSADFNGDGYADLLTVGPQGMDLYIGDGQGGFSYASTISEGYHGPGVVTGDFNGDNRPDFATVGEGGGRVYLNKGPQ